MSNDAQIFGQSSFQYDMFCQPVSWSLHLWAGVLVIICPKLVYSVTNATSMSGNCHCPLQHVSMNSLSVPPVTYMLQRLPSFGVAHLFQIGCATHMWDDKADCPQRRLGLAVIPCRYACINLRIYIRHQPFLISITKSCTAHFTISLLELAATYPN